MSHDVLAALRRRLVTLRGAAGSNRFWNETAGTAPHSAKPLVADGGEDNRSTIGNGDVPDGEAIDSDDDPAGDDAHLRDLPDGAGCAEIWEHLSERQAEERERRAGEQRRADGLAVECRADD